MNFIPRIIESGAAVANKRINIGRILTNIKGMASPIKIQNKPTNQLHFSS